MWPAVELGALMMERARRRARRAIQRGAPWLVGVTALVGCGPEVRHDAWVEPLSRRPYRVVSRANHNRTRPTKVLFSLHAYSTPPDMVVKGYSLVRHAVADRGYVLVVPEGLRDAKGQFHWNASVACCGTGPRHDDLGYLSAVLADLRRRFNVDPKQVFALGVSNGAFMAYRWACSGAEELAGIVAIAGAAPGADDAPCAAQKPVSVLHVHGTHDAIIPYQGKDMPGERYPSAPDSVGMWTKINNCESKSQVSHRRTLFFEPVTIRTWASSRAPVSLWTVEGGSHGLRSVRYFMPDFMEFLALSHD